MELLARSCMHTHAHAVRICNWQFLKESLHGQLPTIYSFCAVREVARAVARIIALALDLKVDFLDQPEMLGEPIAILHLLHYEGGISDPSKGIFGVGAHSDYGLITLLATDGIPGLQICKDRDAKPQIWEDEPTLKG
ncbi:2-oxoglutarate-Fe(II) type oxidoreductase hxnY-like [Quercus lobata]|uniref:2-oxoglutarate-Fe(II) type oxidoreductase hxnY-like n=1 Tax=Quercus lobata TaxID=97700 RepID=UPI001244D940|nr:2-oxoglutarate-Fe(II) type oxidoreductase hxnY-like [Quercus lobata]